MPASKFRPAAIALSATLLLTGCQGIVPGSERDPPRLYELSPKSTFENKLPRVRAQLIVETPVASSGITTSRIAVKVKRTTLDYYEKAEWTDVAPALVQTLLIESFDNSRAVLAVGREASGLRGDYVLKLELREFQAELYKGSNPQVHVRLNVKLMKMPDRRIIAGFRIARKRPAKGATLDQVVDAFDDALGAVMKRLVIWTVRSIHKHRTGRLRRPR